MDQIWKQVNNKSVYYKNELAQTTSFIFWLQIIFYKHVSHFTVSINNTFHLLTNGANDYEKSWLSDHYHHLFRPIHHLYYILPETPTNTSLDSAMKWWQLIRTFVAPTFRHSSDTDTWRSAGRRGGQFQRPFCQVLIEFHQWKWDALYLFRNKIVMLIHFDCHIRIAKQNEWLEPDAATEA